RVVGILGNEPKMRVKGGEPQFLGEIGSLLEVGDSLRAVLPGHQTNRKRALVEVINLGSWATGIEGCDFEIELPRRLPDALQHCVGEILRLNLAGWDSKVMYFLQRL